MQTESLKRLVFQNSMVSSLLMLGLVVLILQIPLSRLDGLISERQQNLWQVQQEIASSWGGEQQVAGPYLVVPFDEGAQPSLHMGVMLNSPERHFAVLLPASLNVSAETQPEIRYRGLYEVPLYQAALNLEATFTKTGIKDLNIDAGRWHWDEARVVLTVSDLRALTGSITAQWQQGPLEVLPGSTTTLPGFHFPLQNAFDAGDSATFTLHFQLNGSQRLMLAPLGRTSVIRMEGAWPSPGFQGDWLPSQRSISAAGFLAQWDIPFIARGMPVQWQAPQVQLKQDELHWVGVQLQPPVDAYRQTERSTKYQLLFLLMIFGFFWLFQQLSGIRLQWVHYLLTGASVCLFYLLLLSLAEHVGFVMAYLTACAAVIAQITLYGRSVLQTWSRALGLGGLLAAMFAYLWSLLQEQDYALLLGAAGLFVSLSLVMYLTRHRQFSH